MAFLDSLQKEQKQPKGFLDAITQQNPAPSSPAPSFTNPFTKMAGSTQAIPDDTTPNINPVGAFLPRTEPVEVRRAFEKTPIKTKAPPIITAFANFGNMLVEAIPKGLATLYGETVGQKRKTPLGEVPLPFSAKRLGFEKDTYTPAVQEIAEKVRAGESPWTAGLNVVSSKILDVAVGAQVLKDVAQVSTKILLNGGLEAKIEAWNILGKPKTLEEAKLNFRQKAFQLHPDTGGSIEQFSTVKKAFSLLEKDGVPSFAEQAKATVGRYSEVATRETKLGKGFLDRIQGVDIAPKAQTQEVNKISGFLPGQKPVGEPQPAFGMSVKKVESVPPVYQGEKDLSTKILKDLEGKSTVSKQYIVDATNRPELKQQERDLVREVLSTYPNGDIPVAEFAQKVKAELLPLETNVYGSVKLGGTKSAKYEGTTLSESDDLRGPVTNYAERIYKSPIKTSAGNSHFPDESNYFGHTRVEDMADNITRRVIEVQSDLYQKGRLESEIPQIGTGSNRAGAEQIAKEDPDSYAAKQLAREKEIQKLQQYSNPTAHFRMVREEIKKAAEDGITKLQFPTGETAMKIEGLGQSEGLWYKIGGEKLKPESLKVGENITQGQAGPDLGSQWIITDVLGDGKFKAVKKSTGTYKVVNGEVVEAGHRVEDSKYTEIPVPEYMKETFDMSGKIDTNNPIYKFYEKDLGRYLTNKYGAKLVTDSKGVKWYEVPVSKEMATKPVEAFSRSPFKQAKGSVSKEEIKKLIFKDIPEDKVRLIFQEGLIDGYANGKYRGTFDGMKGVLKPMIELSTKGGLASPRVAFHESGHYIFDNFLTEAEKKEVLDLAKKEIGFLTQKAYKVLGYEGDDTIAEEYLMDKYADYKANEAGYEGSKFLPFFRKLDEIIQSIIKTYKEVKGKLDQFFKERGGTQGGFIKNPLSDEPPKKVGTVKIGEKEVDVTKGGTMDLPVKRRPIFSEEEPEVALYRRMKVSSQEAANKQYIKKEVRDLKKSLPKEEVMRIRKKEGEIRNLYKTSQGQAEEALGQIMSEMDFAERGERIMIGSGPDRQFTAKPSTFPKWLPDDLKSRELFDRVLARVSDLESLHYPEKTVSQKEARLVDEIYNEIDSRIGVDTSPLREGIVSEYTPEGRLLAKDEKALGKILEKQHKETVKKVYEEERASQDLFKKQREEKETQARLTQELMEKQTLGEKIKLAQKASLKERSFIGKLKQTLKPIESVDPTTKGILKEWISDKNKAVERAQEVFTEESKKGPQTFDEVVEYEAGKETPYIREAFDSLGTEAKRAGLDFGFRQDYMPHVYTQNKEQIMLSINKALKDKGLTDEQIEGYLNGEELPKDTSLRLKLKPNFVKERFFPSYKVAMKYNLTPKYLTPAQHIAHYREALDTAIANKNLIDRLKREAKLLLPEDAPENWVPVTNRFSREGLYAHPDLAKLLNDKFRNEMDLSLYERVVSGASKLANFMQTVKLSAGVPFTNINYFSTGQAVRLLTTALGQVPTGKFREAGTSLKAAFAYIRSNSNKASAQWAYTMKEYIARMALEGYDTSRSLANYKNLNKKFSLLFEGKRGFGPKTAALKDAVGLAWDKAFNDKTFGNFMFQKDVQIFADTYDLALEHGMTDKEAAAFAMKTLRQSEGVSEDMLRSKTTENTLTSLFFAPRFREGIINIVTKAFESFLPRNWSNANFERNKSFVLGAILSYALYNLVNKKINGHFLWDNPPGREFALRIPLNDEDIGYIELLPSTLAFPRNLASGAIALARGDTKTAGQKFGTVFSMPIKTLTELGSNSDYFGREIYKDTDDLTTKIKKGALYTGMAVNHPFISESYRYWTGQQPLWQSLSYMMEFPLKYSTKTKEATSKYYDALDEKKKETAEAKSKIRPIYDHNQKLKAEGKTKEANEVYNALSDNDKKIYDSIKRSEKAKATTKRKIELQRMYEDLQELKADGRLEEANNIYFSLSVDDRKIYDAIKKAAQNTD